MLWGRWDTSPRQNHAATKRAETQTPQAARDEWQRQRVRAPQRQTSRGEERGGKKALVQLCFSYPPTPPRNEEREDSQQGRKGDRGIECNQEAAAGVEEIAGYYNWEIIRHLLRLLFFFSKMMFQGQKKSGAIVDLDCEARLHRYSAATLRIINHSCCSGKKIADALACFSISGDTNEPRPHSRPWPG